MLSGTPLPGTGGTYSLTFTASNGVSPNATQSFTLTIDQTPIFTSANQATFVILASSSFAVTDSAYPTATLAELYAELVEPVPAG